MDGHVNIETSSMDALSIRQDDPTRKYGDGNNHNQPNSIVVQNGDCLIQSNARMIAQRRAEYQLNLGYCDKLHIKQRRVT
jgi:hypothetical protein